MKKGRALFALLLVLMLAACGEHQAAMEETPAAEPEPLSEEEQTELRVAALLDEMSLEEKVGQLFFLRCPEGPGAIDILGRYQVGGVLLFGKDYKNLNGEWLTAEELTQTLAAMKAAVKLTPFIGSDEEGGTVTRAGRSPHLFAEAPPSPQELLALGGTETLYARSQSYASTLSLLGVNVNFAPVCDVTSGEGQFMYARSMGTDAAATADIISGLVDAIHSGGMMTVLKHFPGYGDNVDTHTGIAVDTRPLSQFENGDFLPFSAGIAAGTEFVLVNHNIVECMDAERPASLSPAVHERLRALGFTGIILPDDLDMDAVKSYAESGSLAEAALLAGNDMILLSDVTQIDALIEAVKSGKISEGLIDEHCGRILRVKLNAGLVE